jgi:hypothetical protein
MSKAETVTAAKDVATTLGVGRAMLNRYAATYEAVTGEKITISGRDGRLFSDSQVSVLIRAKNLVSNNHGLSVESALRAALALDPGGAELAVKGVQQSLGEEDKGQLVEALREAITAPLVAELQALRREVAELRQERQLEPPKEPATKVEPKDREKHGVFVRFALWIEERFRG